MGLIRRSILSWVLLIFTGGCIVHTSPSQLAAERATQEAQPPAAVTPTAFLPGQPTSTVTPLPTVTPSVTPVAVPEVWFDPSIPELLRQKIQFNVQTKLAASSESAHLRIGAIYVERGSVDWVYAVVAPFPTVTDGITRDDLRRVWRGERLDLFGGNPLLMSSTTHAAFEALWGPSSGDGVGVIEENELLDYAWETRPSWALIPFEELEPRWKVLRVDGESPLDKAFNPARYPLVVRFGATEAEKADLVILPGTNRDPEHLTVIVMTGVTALTRATGWQMEQQGMTFPGQDIWPWLREADITHISNESSFSPNCPAANPYQTSLIFCSRPEYLQLLEYVGTDVVELTGNHLMDWGAEALEYTLSLLKERGIHYYAAAENQEASRAPLLLEHNGNKIAFIGCNPSGPPGVWATDYRVGVAHCMDYGWVKDEIQKQLENGYLPIVTLQYHETYSLAPSPFAVRDFQPLSEAGAAIVSGSQAHYPHGLTFLDGRFIHYGLGNFFFDQMYTPEGSGPRLFNPDELPIPGTRLEFIDRHIIYEGRHISTELLTAVLEDYARPRPMTDEERRVFLRDTFKASGW
jgi:hypothetical protein